MTRQTSPTYRSTAKLKVCKETFLPKCYQMRIGYITCVIYNTPDNLRIALEDNLIENSAKNSENHKLRINTNTFVQIALQCNGASYVCHVCINDVHFVLLTSFSILQVWNELLFPISNLINDTTVNLFNNKLLYVTIR